MVRPAGQAKVGAQPGAVNVGAGSDGDARPGGCLIAEPVKPVTSVDWG